MNLLNKVFEGVANKLKIDFEEQAGILGHPGEVGTGRENVLMNLLSKYIQKRYGVDSGFIIDALGNKSEQMDILIYESNYTPVFEVVDNKRFFPCETVVAMGQVRTTIGSRADLVNCLNNIKSAKALDRSNKGENELITGPGISLQPLRFDPNKEFRDQIFGFIFCSSSIKPELVIAELQKYNEHHERKLWVNTVVNYNKFLTMYREGDFLSEDPMKAEEIVLTDLSQTPHILALFVSVLNNFLNIAHIARPNLFSYFNLRQIGYHKFPL